MKRVAIFNTPIGPVRVAADARGLLSLDFRAQSPKNRVDTFFKPVEKALRDYFAGRPLPKFPLGDLGGTPFRRKVWNALGKIPFGETRSYGEVAKSVGVPGAARAVGSACGANPLPLFIPCHRVLAAGGKLGGFSGGLGIKRKLLELESCESFKSHAYRKTA